MDQRAIACFDQALDDVGLARDERLCRVLHDYFAWATTTTMARYHHSAEEVPDGLQIPKWSWHGLVSGGETAHRGGPLMDAVALVLEHSVEADVSRAFAWKFRTNVATWNDPPATFVLDGEFTDGSQGSTMLPGQTPLTWWIRDVHEERSFAIEMLLDRVTLRFEWYFDVVGGGGTKLTQRIVLSGTNAPAYREQVEAGFRPTLADGMRRVAADMVAAQRGSKDPG